MPSRKHLAQVLLEAREVLPSPLHHATSEAMGRLGFPGFPPSLLLVSIILFRSPSSWVPTAQDAWAFLLIRAPGWAPRDLPLWIPELHGGDSTPSSRQAYPLAWPVRSHGLLGLVQDGYVTQSGTVRPNVGFLEGW